MLLCSQWKRPTPSLTPEVWVSVSANVNALASFLSILNWLLYPIVSSSFELNGRVAWTIQCEHILTTKVGRRHSVRYLASYCNGVALSICTLQFQRVDRKRLWFYDRITSTEVGSDSTRVVSIVNRFRCTSRNRRCDPVPTAGSP